MKKGTTLTELNDAYENQAIALAQRAYSAANWTGYDSFFCELAINKRKIIPRGKTFIRLLTICKKADFYD